MKSRTSGWPRRLLLAGLLGLVLPALAVPLGYRYVGSRVISLGRVVYWYWNVDYVEIGPYEVSFVARMFARSPDTNEERAYVAVVRCDSRTYRPFGAQSSYEAIDEDEPINAVWRAGCEGGRAVSLAQRNARMNVGSAPAPASPTVASALPAPSAKAVSPPVASTSPGVAAAPLGAAASAAVAAVREEPRDERRVDQCVKFAEGRASQFGDATVTNTCGFAVEVALCYKGARGGLYDCPPQPKGKRMESLSAGATRNLPEYRRDRHKGIALVACKGTLGSVMPLLEGDGGKSGCG